MCYVYIVECADGSFYTGWTLDIKRRIAQHNNGTGGKYTRSRPPIVLKYYEEYETRSQAMKREAQIKKLTRSEKQNLINAVKNP